MTSNWIYPLGKTKGVKLPFETENKNISLHLHARSKQLLLPLILYTLKLFQIEIVSSPNMSFELEATIRDL